LRSSGSHPDPRKRLLPRPVSFHAFRIHARAEPPWDTLTAAQAADVLRWLARLVSDSHETCALFAIVVQAILSWGRPYNFAFNELTRRFDLYLTRLHAQGDTQRGLMVFDESRHEQRLQTLLRSYTVEGGPFGRLRNFSDIPLFANSRSSRMLQLADYVAWATFRRYERAFANHFDQIVGRFDSEGGHMHGLLHRTRSFLTCYCPACHSRRLAGHPPTRP
jgi:uncharacterized protein DUF3800